MTNADRFKAIFGLYATELWAKPEKEFLKWLNADATDTNVGGNLIDRQAALDAMETWDKFGCDPDGKLVRYDDDKHYIPYVHYEDMVHAIKHLPSAQPERTCVNCGRTANNGGWYADGGTRCPIEEHYALPKDGFCHLWEKRNVTDDDYPERREDERPES